MPHPFNLKRPPQAWKPTGRKRDILFTTGISAAPPVSVEYSPLSALEAVLFLAKEPLPVRKLTQLMKLPEQKTLPAGQVKELLRQLNEQYTKSRSAFRIAELANGYQLRTKPELAPYLMRMQEVPPAIRLSQPAMETLTVIAHKQPVVRAEVERIRGVSCGDLIRQLLDWDLVAITGRSEDLGRPFLYGTTKKFLQVFGLNSAEDLPQ